MNQHASHRSRPFRPDPCPHQRWVMDHPGVSAQPIWPIRVVATVVGARPGRLRRMVERGEFPAPVAVGRSRHWRPADVREWLSGIERA